MNKPAITVEKKDAMQRATTLMKIKQAYTDMVTNTRTAFPQAKIDIVTIPPMIRTPDGELILGVKKDLDFGPVILLGMGGRAGREQWHA